MYVKIEFTPDKTSNPTKGTLTATCETEIIHSDVVDIAKDNAREKFIKRLCNTAPAVNAGDVRHLILQQLAQINDRIKQQQQQEEEKKEICVGNIARPQLFHLKQVSGLIVPVAYLDLQGVLQGDYVLATQHRNGQRKFLEIPEFINTEDGTEIRLDPIPSPPKPNTLSQWSRQSREAWLNGYTPDLADIFQRLAELFSW